MFFMCSSRAQDVALLLHYYNNNESACANDNSAVRMASVQLLQESSFLTSADVATTPDS